MMEELFDDEEYLECKENKSNNKKVKKYVTSIDCTTHPKFIQHYYNALSTCRNSPQCNYHIMPLKCSFLNVDSQNDPDNCFHRYMAYCNVPLDVLEENIKNDTKQNLGYTHHGFGDYCLCNNPLVKNTYYKEIRSCICYPRDEFYYATLINEKKLNSLKEEESIPEVDDTCECNPYYRINCEYFENCIGCSSPNISCVIQPASTYYSFEYHLINSQYGQRYLNTSGGSWMQSLTFENICKLLGLLDLGLILFLCGLWFFFSAVKERLNCDYRTIERKKKKLSKKERIARNQKLFKTQR